MANEKILAKKQEIIDEIKDKVQNANGVVLFAYSGLTDEESKELRRKLKETNSDYKIYKNTLMARAFKDMNLDVADYLKGSSALAYGEDTIAPIKTVAEFAKKHDKVILKVGVVDGEVTNEDKLKELATIPSREGLLTMLAAGMLGIPKDLSICLDLLAKQKEEN